MNKEEIINEVKKRLGYLDNDQLFDGVQYTQKELEELFVSYLQIEGYKISKRPSMTHVKHVDQLVDYFYAMLEFHMGDGLSFVSNRTKDIAIISRFVNQRKKELNCSTQFAIGDCALIIKTLFEIEDTLDLDAPLGIWIFGTDKCKWITDRVISIINDRYRHENDLIMEERAAEFEDEQGNSYKGFDFDEIKRRRQSDGEESK